MCRIYDVSLLNEIIEIIEMSGTTAELYWFPKYQDRFITWGSEINLYQTKDEEPGQRLQTSENLVSVTEGQHSIFTTCCYTDIQINISSKKTATLLATETRYQYIRCVAPAYRANELCLGVGLANGKVGLCNFVPSTENNIEFSKTVALQLFIQRFNVNSLFCSAETVTTLRCIVMA